MPVTRDLYSVVNDARKFSSEVLVFFSGGLDSIVTLDLCKTRFDRVKLVHLYTVKDLNFQTGPIKAYAKRYDVEFIQIMHPDILTWFNKKKIGKKLPKVRMGDAVNLAREITGMDWVAFGFRREDSVGRSIRMTKCSGIDIDNRQFFPLMDWNRKKCMAYLRSKRVPLPRTYQEGYRDIHTFKGHDIVYIAHNHPEDYQKILKAFPWVEGEYVKAMANI